MKKSLGTRISPDYLQVGSVYRVRVPALGEVFAKLLDKQNSLFEVTAGMLKSPSDKRKTWCAGQQFTAPLTADYYEVPEL